MNGQARSVIVVDYTQVGVSINEKSLGAAGRRVVNFC